MAATIATTRQQWLGYRAAAQGLAGGGAGREVLNRLLRLGVQNTPAGTALLALRARTSRIGRTSLAKAFAPAGPLVLMWSVRGAPHAHALTDIDLVRAAHYPLDPDDTWTRMAGWATHLDNGDDPRDQLDTVAAAMRKTVTEPVPKPELSQRVSALVPESLRLWCGRCESHHVPDPLFRLGGLQAKLAIDAEAYAPTVLRPAPDHEECKSAEQARATLLRTFLTVQGPTKKALFAGWMAASTAAAGVTWQALGDEIVPVRLDGKRYWMLERDTAALLDAPPAEGVALVPPHDPFLQGVEKPLLLPHQPHRADLWRALSSPGAVLVRGEVAGSWRHRQSGDRLKITITQYGTIARADRAALLAEAQEVAKVRGLGAAELDWQAP